MARSKLAQKILTACGSIIFTTVKMKKARPTGGKRKAKQNPTIEEVLKINEKIAEINLAIKLNYNYKGGDMHVVLTYRNEPTNEEARKALDWAIREFRKELKKQGIILKGVTATEYEDKRIHHHVVITKLDLEVVRRIWKKYGDIVRVSILDDSRDYRALAHYLIKETSKTFRKPDAFSKRRYNCTRSIVTPTPRAIDADPSDICDEPKPEKGYYIEKESIFKGINPFNNQPYVMYVQVALDAEQPRLKPIRRGKPRKNLENDYSGWLRKNMPRQLEMNLSGLCEKACS